jgi:hypothetical protein
MGWNIENKEKLVISEDENNAHALKHLLDEMGKEDAGGRNRKPAKFKNKYVGDESDEDDDYLSVMTPRNMGTVFHRFDFSCFLSRQLKKVGQRRIIVF